jgi:hypothetical protein
MEDRINKQSLLDILVHWNSFLKKKIHLIACGGTAMTLLNIKESTKDIDFIVPKEKEYDYLIKILKQLGYKTISGTGYSKGGGFVFDLFKGNKVHTTELLESPLKENNHIIIEELSRIYLGVLNYYDLIIAKLFRAATVDMEDCLTLVKRKRREIDVRKLVKRYREAASFDIAQERINKHLDSFLRLLKKEGIEHGR